MTEAGGQHAAECAGQYPAEFPDEYVGEYPDKYAGEYAAADLTAALQRIGGAQDEIRAGLGRLSERLDLIEAHLVPLLTDQFEQAQQRMRALETRIRNRQERPLIVRMARLLGDVRRLTSDEDVRRHVEEALADALTSLGYEETGAEGEPFDPRKHEPVAGSVGRAGIVSRVHRRGLSCYDDVIMRSAVEVAPTDPEPALACANAEAAAEDERGEFPA